MHISDQPTPEVEPAMDRIICSFSSILQAADALAGEMAKRRNSERHGIRIYKIPFNRYQPLAAPWWLVPQNTREIHPYGKIIIRPLGRPPTGFFVGLHVEKGIGPDAARRYRLRTELVMKKSWIWHVFRTDLVTGYIQDAVRDAAEKLGCNVWFQMRLMKAVHLLAGEPDRVNPEHINEFLWRARGNAIRLVKSRCRSDPAKSLTSCTSLADVAFILDQPELQEWWWVDVQIGTEFDFPRTSADPSRAWSAGEIFDRAVEPWLPWYR